MKTRRVWARFGLGSKITMPGSLRNGREYPESRSNANRAASSKSNYDSYQAIALLVCLFSLDNCRPNPKLLQEPCVLRRCPFFPQSRFISQKGNLAGETERTNSPAWPPGPTRTSPPRESAYMTSKLGTTQESRHSKYVK